MPWVEAYSGRPSAGESSPSPVPSNPSCRGSEADLDDRAKRFDTSFEAILKLLRLVGVLISEVAEVRASAEL